MRTADRYRKDLKKGAGDTYNILYSLGDAAFYFLPPILGFTAAKRCGFVYVYKSELFFRDSLCREIFPNNTSAVINQTCMQ